MLLLRDSGRQGGGCRLGVLGLHAWNEIGNAYHRAPLIRRKQGGLVGLTCSPHKEHLRWEQRPLAAGTDKTAQSCNVEPSQRRCLFVGGHN
jgi:hypothetical protein